MARQIASTERDVKTMSATGPAYSSSLMPLSWTIFCHNAVSVAICRANCAGVLPTAALPSASSVAITSVYVIAVGAVGATAASVAGRIYVEGYANA